MPGLWKAWKAKSRLPPVSTGPWKSRQGQARFPHFHSSGGKQADGKVENQKQVSHFPTATNPFSRNQNRATGGLRPPPCAASLRPASANDVYHSVTLSGEATRPGVLIVADQAAPFSLTRPRPDGYRVLRVC